MKFSMENIALRFLSHHVESILEIDRKTLWYWRKIGLFEPSEKPTDGGHYRYTFKDLVALKTICSIREAGISTFRLKHVANALRKLYPSLNPLSEKSLYVVGTEVIVADGRVSFNPITGQGTFIKIEHTRNSIRKETLKSFGAITETQSMIEVNRGK